MNRPAGNIVHSNEDTPKKNQVKKSNILSIIQEYTSRTTFHGVHYVFHVGSKLRRTIWLLFLLTSFTYFLFSSWKLYSRYRSYPISTKNKIVYPDEMLFPAITICNFNRFRKSQIGLLQQEVKEKNLSGRIVDDRDFSDFFLKFGHKMDEEGMLLDCKWRGKNCSSKDFISTIEHLGLCHTFNSGKRN